MSLLLFYILIFLLSVIQTSAGVGVLVLGTPTLLIMKFNLLEAINILLPISIFTSLLNLIYFKSNKKKLKIIDEKNIAKIFFTYCLPGVFVGTILIYYLNPFFKDFKILISVLILFSILLKNTYKRSLIEVRDTVKKTFIAVIGALHGLTNSGGSLLTLFVLSFGKNRNTVSSRYNITLFYFSLGVVQYFFFYLAFYKSEVISFNNFSISLIIVFFGCVIGNLISKFIDKKIFNILIDALAFLAATSLLIF